MRQIYLIIAMAVGLLSSVAQAAGPAMHIALGNKWLSFFAQEYSEQEKKLFLLGTVFPDIRYLGVVKRNQTHYQDVTLEKVYAQTTPFMRGVYFHSFVDEYREKYIREHDIKKKVSALPRALQGTFLKVVEDEILHAKHDWSEFRIYLSVIPDEEKILDIQDETLTQWHTGLTFYFTACPSIILTQLSLFEKGILTLDAATVKSWSILVPQYAANPEMIKYLDNFMASFDKTLHKTFASLK